MQRAVRSKRPSSPLHGQSIYAYWHVRTKQVLYSLTRVLDSKQSLKQLPDLGANANPVSIRKDLWKPLFTLTLPRDRNPRTPDGKVVPTRDNPDRLFLEHTQGIDAFRRLREYRELHELYWTPPEELSYTYTEADIEEVEEKLRKRGGSKKETAHDIIKREKKKMRRKAVMDQKATSVADLAEVLRNQEEAGLEVERKQREVWRKTRAKEIRTILEDTTDFEAAKERAYEDAEKLRVKLKALKEDGGNRSKERETEIRQARWRLAQAVKVKKRLLVSMSMVEEAHARPARSLEYLQKLWDDNPEIVEEEHAKIDGPRLDIQATLVKEVRPEVLDFLKEVEKMMASKDQLDQETGMRQLEENRGDAKDTIERNEAAKPNASSVSPSEQQVSEVLEATERNEVVTTDPSGILPFEQQGFEEVAQIWRGLELESLDDQDKQVELSWEVFRLMERLRPLEEERDLFRPEREALIQEREALALEKKQTEDEEAERAEAARRWRPFSKSKQEESTIQAEDESASFWQRKADFDTRWDAHDALWREVQERIAPMENELAGPRKQWYDLILRQAKKRALKHVLISRGRDPERRDFGVVLIKSPSEPKQSDAPTEDVEASPQTVNSAEGESSVESTAEDSDTLVPDPSLPVWHALLPDLKPLPTFVRGMRRHDPDRSKVRLLNAPIFRLDGIKIQWADIMDANHAESWPENIVHEELGWSRGTAKKVEDDPILEPTLPVLPKIKGPLKIRKEKRDLRLRETVERLTGEILKGLAAPKMPKGVSNADKASDRQGPSNMRESVEL